MYRFIKGPSLYASCFTLGYKENHVNFPFLLMFQPFTKEIHIHHLHISLTNNSRALMLNTAKPYETLSQDGERSSPPKK